MLEDLKPPTPKRSCKVAKVLEGLSDSDKAIFAKALASPEWPIKALSRAVNERGIQISESPLANHRSKSCACHA